MRGKEIRKGRKEDRRGQERKVERMQVEKKTEQSGVEQNIT
jgi:hypothetical protein